MYIKNIFLAVLSVFSLSDYLCQEDEWDSFDDTPSTVELFNDTRVINGHSTQTLEKGMWDLRITHRFGDMAVPNAGRSLFGIDNSTDIRIAIEYGVSDDFSIGFGRSKGFAPYSQLWDGYLKYAVFKQSEKTPFSLTVASSAFATSMLASTDSTSPTSFTKNAHRFSYYTQVIMAKNFFDKLTLQIAPGILYRNFVANDDQNLNFTIGGMARYNFYKKLSFLVEYYQVFRESDVNNGMEYVNPLGIGLEIKTFSHVFQLHFMNSESIGEGQFIPYTQGNWLDGRFRFGFNISRHF
jgi:hypothetical protein